MAGGKRRMGMANGERAIIVSSVSLCSALGRYPAGRCADRPTLSKRLKRGLTCWAKLVILLPTHEEMGACLRSQPPFGYLPSLSHINNVEPEEYAATRATERRPPHGVLKGRSQTGPRNGPGSCHAEPTV